MKGPTDEEVCPDAEFPNHRQFANIVLRYNNPAKRRSSRACFELRIENEVVGSKPENWFCVERGGFKARVSDDSPQTGDRCIKISKSERTKKAPFGSVNFGIDLSSIKGKRIRFRAFVRAEVGDDDRVGMWLREDLKSGTSGAFDNMSDRPIKSAKWREYEIVADISEDAKAVTMGVLLHGKGTAYVDNVVVEIVDESVESTIRTRRNRGAATVRKAVAPGLFEINGAMEVHASGNRLKWGKDDLKEARFLLPLPLTHRSQYPLTYNLEADPPEALKSVVIYEDNPQNFVAEVILQDLAKHSRVKLTFNSTILVLPTSFADVPKSAAMPKVWPAESTPWLESTWCVDSDDERIKAIGVEIRAQTNDVLQIIKHVESRAKKIYGSADGRVKNLIAVEALDKRGSCTSCGNLVAALLRASNVPARVLAGYPSWSGPLQTHYIVEAYVPNYGWYPIESTMCQSPWPNMKQINVSIVPTEYESRELAGRRTRIAGGVPYLSLTESPGNKGAYFTVGCIPGKRFCDHECKFVRKLDFNDEQWQTLSRWAKPRWSQWLESEPQVSNGKLEFGPLAGQVKSETPGELMDEISSD